MYFKFLFTSLFLIFLFSCKEQKENRSILPVSSLEKDSDITKTRDTLNRIKLSLETDENWVYNEKNSQLHVLEKEHYLEKVTYEKASNNQVFRTLSYTVAKKGIVLSLNGGLEGALSNMIATHQGILIEREDVRMDDHFGYESVFSKGKLKSKDPKVPEITYRLMILINQSEMYFVLGLFLTESDNAISDFENEINSIKILNLNS